MKVRISKERKGNSELDRCPKSEFPSVSTLMTNRNPHSFHNMGGKKKGKIIHIYLHIYVVYIYIYIHKHIHSETLTTNLSLCNGLEGEEKGR